MSWLDWLDGVAAVIRDLTVIGGTALLLASLVLAALTGRVCRLVWLRVHGQHKRYFYGLAYRVHRYHDRSTSERGHLPARIDSYDGDRLLSVHGVFRRHPQNVTAVTVGKVENACELHTVTPIKTTWRILE